jgi:hypothetical protein
MNRAASLLAKYFYLFMSVLIAAVVVYGFSFTMGKRLLHPSSPPPAVLYFHAAIFYGWLMFFVLQSALIRARKVKLHRTLGWFGAALGVLMVLVGIYTAIHMTGIHIARDHSDTAAADLIVPLWDMLCFTITFGLAIYWRKKPEYHRRLVLVATCVLTAAAFGRLPSHLVGDYFYAGVDLLILLGVVRDLAVNRRVHPVYLAALPLLIAGQTIIMYTDLHNSPWWLAIAHGLLA